MAALKGKVKFIVWALAVIGIVAFFLPFLKFSIVEPYKSIVEAEGMDSTGSISIFNVATGPEFGGEKANGSPLMFIMLALPILALAFSFIPNKKVRAILYIVVAVPVLLLTMAEFVVNKSRLAVLGDMINIGIGFGFILYMIHGVGMSVAAVLDMKTEEIKAEE